MGGFKNFWKGNSWWAALFWFLGGGCMAWLWSYIFSRTGNPLHFIFLSVFVVFSIYNLVKFVTFLKARGKKQLS